MLARTTAAAAKVIYRYCCMALFTNCFHLCRLLEVNPAGTLPILKDLAGDKFVSDSDAITDYLEDKFPSKNLGKVADVPQP